MNTSKDMFSTYSGDGHAVSLPVIESISDVRIKETPTKRDHSTSVNRRVSADPTPVMPTSNPDVMDRLASRFSSFALVAARGRVQPGDVDDLEVVCQQVQQSIEELKAEAQRRQQILDSIKRSYVALNHVQPETGPSESAMIYRLNTDTAENG